MGQAHTEIAADLQAWIAEQHVFFVATAPLDAKGHINCSPKGGDTFRILDARTVAYQDLTGSGAETIAHVRENGRMVIMFCAFEGSPIIARLYGTAEVILPGDAPYATLAARFPANAGMRAIIRMAVSRVGESCGMAVPLLAYCDDRGDLDEWAESRGPEKLLEYRRKKNAASIDGLPAIPRRGEFPTPGT